MLPGQAVCPVLKSNAYGHGLTEIAKILAKEDPEFLIVDSLYEAYQLKKAKITTPILILGYTFHENLKAGLPFHFVASDLETLRALAKLKLPIHVEIDTGIARTGFTLDELGSQIEEISAAKPNIVGVFTHFADADNPETDQYTKLQCQKFSRALQLLKSAGFTPKWVHASNSAGALKTQVPELNMARVGISLYGLNPLKASDPQFQKLAGLEPVMEVSSTIIAIKNLKRGDKASYNCTFEAPRDMRIGIIPFGYYEGLPRSLSNKAPFLGRICMNHALIDLNEPEFASLKPGDPFVVYSRDKSSPLSFHKMAEKAGTITYELTTKIAESMRREVTN